MYCLVNEELGGWSHLEGSGQWFNVWMYSSDKWPPSGVCVGTNTVLCLHQ